MIFFSTEFPVLASENRSAFVALVFGWLRGMKHETVLANRVISEVDGANVYLRSEQGEELRMRELEAGEGWTAVGARHDLPDNEGRLWRTECVLKRATGEDGQDLVRVRTQCIARSPGAKLAPPKKPYLIKALLKGGWGGADGQLAISDQPVWLEDTEDGLAMARAVTRGAATKWLPTVYISATGAASWILDRTEIEKLAYDLGGIAHVVVEPDRVFSFKLREETQANNAYGGTLGLAAPGQGVIRRYYIGWEIQSPEDLAAAVRSAASRLRSQLPASGWDWTELQEQFLRAQRARDANQLTEAESEKLYLDEIENLQDKIRELEQQLSSGASEGVGTDEGAFSAGNLVRKLGPEIYPGEISDRLRLAARTTLNAAEREGLDPRSTAILQRVLDRLPVSPALSEFLQDLSRATKDPRRMATDVTALLARHGYSHKSDKNHVRLDADKDYEGVGSLTLATTPSEYKGMKNLRKQIERGLGLTKLKA